MRKLISLLAVICLMAFFAGCGSADKTAQNAAGVQQQTAEAAPAGHIETPNATKTEKSADEMMITITADGHTVKAVLYDNAAGKVLYSRLPMKITMMNLYGREMCHRFGAGGLPANDAAVKGYEIGDISYWPPAGSLVILYEQNGEIFEQQPIGHIDGDISFFRGMGDTEITFEKLAN